MQVTAILLLSLAGFLHADVDFVQYMQDQNNGEICEVCKQTVQDTLDSLASTVDKIQTEVCPKLPSALQSSCTEAMEKIAAQLSGTTAEELCTQAHLCDQGDQKINGDNLCDLCKKSVDLALTEAKGSLDVATEACNKLVPDGKLRELCLAALEPAKQALEKITPLGQCQAIKMCKEELLVQNKNNGEICDICKLTVQDTLDSLSSTVDKILTEVCPNMPSTLQSKCKEAMGKIAAQLNGTTAEQVCTEAHLCDQGDQKINGDNVCDLCKKSVDLALTEAKGSLDVATEACNKLVPDGKLRELCLAALEPAKQALEKITPLGQCQAIKMCKEELLTHDDHHHWPRRCNADLFRKCEVAFFNSSGISVGKDADKFTHDISAVIQEKGLAGFEAICGSMINVYSCNGGHSNMDACLRPDVMVKTWNLTEEDAIGFVMTYATIGGLCHPGVRENIQASFACIEDAAKNHGDELVKCMESNHTAVYEDKSPLSYHMQLPSCGGCSETCKATNQFIHCHAGFAGYYCGIDVGGKVCEVNRNAVYKHSDPRKCPIHCPGDHHH